MLLHKRMAGFRSLVKKTDIRLAEVTLSNLDSLYKALKHLDGLQAAPYSDSLDTLHSALDAKKEELKAVQRHKDSLQTAASERISTIKAARAALYKVRSSEEVQETMKPYLEKLGRMQAETFNAAAMRNLKKEIIQYTRDLVSREKTARRAQQSRAKQKSH